MRKTLRIIVAVISLIAALSSFIIFSFRLNGLKTTGERSSGAEYSILRNALGTVETRESLQDILLRERLVSLYKGSERLLAAQVLDDSGLTAWRMPDGSAYFARPDDPRNRSGFSAPSGSTIMFTTPLKGGMKLTALYVTLRKDDIVDAAKLPLLIAALWAAIALLAFFLLNPETGNAILPEAILTIKGEPLFRKNAARAVEGKTDKKADVKPAQPRAETEAANPEAAKTEQQEPRTAKESQPVQDGNTSQEAQTIQQAEAAEPVMTAPVQPMTLQATVTASTAISAAVVPASAAADPGSGPRPGPGNIEDSLARLEHEISAWTGRQSQSVQASPEPSITAPAPEESQLDDELVEELETLEEMEEIEALNGLKDNGQDQSPAATAVKEPDFEEEAGRKASGQDSLPPEQNEAEKELAETMEVLQEFEDMDLESVPEPENALPRLQENLDRSHAAAAFESLNSPEKNERPRVEIQEKQDVSSLPMPLSLQDSELETRLGSELARGPKAEISLLLIHCTVSSRSDPAAVALAVTIKDYIGSKELVFELYKGAFAVVLPSVDLGGALKMSEDLADVLAATLSLYRDLEGEAPVFIGISARSERNVDAFKLYREASTAVHKAYSGGRSRILAFRARNEQP